MVTDRPLGPASTEAGVTDWGKPAGKGKREHRERERAQVGRWFLSLPLSLRLFADIDVIIMIVNKSNRNTPLG